MRDVLKELLARFEAGQDRVRVKLVNQVTYRDTLAKYRAGLVTGDLPDLVSDGLGRRPGTGGQWKRRADRSVRPRRSKYPRSDFVPSAPFPRTRSTECSGLCLGRSRPPC